MFNLLVKDRFSPGRYIARLKERVQVFYKHELRSLAELFSAFSGNRQPKGVYWRHELTGLSDVLCLEKLSLPPPEPWLSPSSLPYRLAGTLSVSALLSLGGVALALPQGYESVEGNIQFQQSGNTLNISTQAHKSIAQYQQFNVGAGETVNFNLPSAQSAILNRVVGPDVSQILGKINSNGQVFLTNPNGIVFGQGAQVNVSGLLASTLSISNQDFMAGQYTFKQEQGKASAKVQNDGSITVDKFALLAGGAVENTGTISTTDSGSINLAVGKQLSVSVDQNLSIAVTVDESLQAEVQGAQSAIVNSGILSANGGAVQAQAKLTQGLYERSINNTGHIEAKGLGDLTGEIVLQADTGQVRHAGTIDTSSSTGKGGEIRILGETVALTGSSVTTANGQTGGGSILIGGDWQGQGSTQTAWHTFVGDGANIQVDALATGHGGKVVVWADDRTWFYGDISARGGLTGGNGGQVEVSGKHFLTYQGQVDTRAPQGHTGSLLLDPTNIEVVSAGSETSTLTDADAFADPDIGGDGDVKLDVTAINNALSNVTLQASNNILFSAPINITTSGVGLYAYANNDITVNQSITTNAGEIGLWANNDMNANGTLTINAQLSTNNKRIELAGAEMRINADINAGSTAIWDSTINIHNNAARTIQIGGSVDDADSASIFDISQAELYRLTAFSKGIGGYGSGHTNLIETAGNVTLGIDPNNHHFSLTSNNVTINHTVSFGHQFSIVTDQLDINQNMTLGGLLVTNRSAVDIYVGGAVDNADTASRLDISAAELSRLTVDFSLEFLSRYHSSSTLYTAGNLSFSAPLNILRFGQYGNQQTVINHTINAPYIAFGGTSITINQAVSAASDIYFNEYSLINTPVTLNANLTAPTIHISANGSASLSQLSGTLNATSLTLISHTGNIGTSSNRIQTNTATLTATTGGSGNIYITEANSLTLGNSSAGGTFDLIAGGAITGTGTLAGSNISLSTSAANSGISLASGLSANNITIFTTGTNSEISINGNITANNNLLLSSRYGNLSVNGNLSHTGGSGTMLTLNAGYHHHLYSSEDSNLRQTLVENASAGILLGGTLTITDDAGKKVLISSGTNTIFSQAFFSGNNRTFDTVSFKTAASNNTWTFGTGGNLGNNWSLSSLYLVSNGSNSNLVYNGSYTGTHLGLYAMGSGSTVTVGTGSHGTGNVTASGVVDLWSSYSNVTVYGNISSTGTANTYFRLSAGNEYSPQYFHANYGSGTKTAKINVTGNLNVQQHSNKSFYIWSGSTTGLTGSIFENSFFNQDLSFRNITLGLGGDNMPLTLNHNLTATEWIFFASRGDNNSITQAANKLITAQQIYFESTSSVNNNIGTAANPIQVNTDYLNISGAGPSHNNDVFIHEQNDIGFGYMPWGSTGIESRQRGTLSLSANGSITSYTGGVRSWMSGDVILRADADSNNVGTLTLGGPVSAASGNIILSGAQIQINGSVDAGTGTVTITPSTAKAIQIAGATDQNDSASLLDISSAELGRITAGSVLIGDAAKTGGLTIAGNLNLSGTGTGKYNLTLNNAGNITSANNAFTLGSHTLDLYAGTTGDISVTNTLNNNPIRLTNLTGNNVTVSSSMAPAGGSPISIAGNVAASGNLILSAAGSHNGTHYVTVGGNITNTGGTVVTLSGYAFTLNGNLSISDNSAKAVILDEQWGNLYTKTSFWNSDHTFNSLHISSVGRAYNLGGNLTLSGNFSVLAASLTQTSGTLLTANRIKLQNGGGTPMSAGSSSHYLDTITSILELVDWNYAYINNSGNLSIITQGGGILGTLSVSNNNNISVNNALINAQNITLQTTANNSNIILNQNITVTTGIALTTHGTGNVTVASGRTVTATNNPISITTNDLILNGSLNAGTGTVTIAPNGNKTITLAGTTGYTPGTLDISAAELRRITAGTLSIGNAALASNISMVGNLDLSGVSGTAGVYNLAINTAGNFSNNGYTLNLGRDALYFDGINDFVYAPGTYTFTTNNQITLVSWVRLTNPSSYEGLISSGTTYRMLITPPSNLYPFYNAGQHFDGTIPYSLQTGQWYQLVMSIQGGGNINTYLNGINISTTSAGVAANMSDVNHFYLGTGEGGALHYLSGLLDNVQIYNRVLSGVEVSALYNQGVGVTTPASTTGLAAGWNFAEGAGTSTADFSANTNTGTLTNGPTWVRANNLTVNAGGAVNTGNILSDGGQVGITSAGNITVSGNVQSIGRGTVTMATTANNSSIALAGNVQGDSGITLITHGSGNITQSAGTLTAGTLALASGTGNIGNSSNPIRTAASTLTANTGGNVFIEETDNLTLGASSAGAAFQLQTLNSGNLTLAGAVSASGSGDAVVLAAGGSFINNVGNTAISAVNGRWKVYSSDPGSTTEGGLTYNKRYGISYGDDVSAYSNGNYIFYSITPTLTVTAENKSKTYGSSNPTFTSVITGFIDGDTLGSAVSGSASYTTSATNTSNVGNYTITAGAGTLASSLGYSFTYVDGNLEVTKANLTVTADNKTKTYGSANPALTATYSGFVLGQDASVIDTLAALSISATSASNVGSYAISATAALDNNYSFTYVDGNLEVTKASLTISADNQSKAFGMANPALTARYSGFVLGEDVSVLNTQPVLSTLANATSLPGEYAITISGAQAANYTISYLNGILTVQADNPLFTQQGSQSLNYRYVDLANTRIQPYAQVQQMAHSPLNLNTTDHPSMSLWLLTQTALTTGADYPAFIPQAEIRYAPGMRLGLPQPQLIKDKLGIWSFSYPDNKDEPLLQSHL